MQLTKNFSRYEFDCKCGCGQMNIPMEEIYWLQKIRTEAGFMFKINSGYRCPDHNEKTSSTGRDGPHTKAAFDIGVSGEQAFRLVEIALKHGATGIGISQKGPHASRFIHIDRLKDGTRPWIWSY